MTMVGVTGNLSLNFDSQEELMEHPMASKVMLTFEQIMAMTPIFNTIHEDMNSVVGKKVDLEGIKVESEQMKQT